MQVGLGRRSFLIGVLAMLNSGIVMPAEDPGQPTGLVEALTGKDAVARFQAEERLVVLGDAALPALGRLAASRGHTPAREYAINILARIASPKAVRLLCEILQKEPNVMVRGVICQHLGRMGVAEAVPIICKWLLTIEGQSLGIGGGDRWGNPMVVTTSYAWVRHVHALRNIGREEAIPVLEQMQRAGNGGRGGKRLMRAYQDDLRELRSEAAFWRSVRAVPGLEDEVARLFRFFRRDPLALIRLYRDKVIGLGTEGRWVLEGLQKHSDPRLSEAAERVLAHYGKLRG